MQQYQQEQEQQQSVTSWLFSSAAIWAGAAATAVSNFLVISQRSNISSSRSNKCFKIYFLLTIMWLVKLMYDWRCWEYGGVLRQYCMSPRVSKWDGWMRPKLFVGHCCTWACSHLTCCDEKWSVQISCNSALKRFALYSITLNLCYPHTHSFLHFIH